MEVERGRKDKFRKKCTLENVLYFNTNVFFKILEERKLDSLDIEAAKSFGLHFCSFLSCIWDCNRIYDRFTVTIIKIFSLQTITY